ncbi:unnamed protein product [Protopolystoma xenopodis]|uniref:Uncharacterized protein n=1 Tax=Protopolystoma xenopodis TaxID=117903 RepID=A0A3S5CJT3_9PLAT|nr:unnamed protein product [Protopolystoma xenopodis]
MRRRPISESHLAEVAKQMTIVKLQDARFAGCHEASKQRITIVTLASSSARHTHTQDDRQSLQFTLIRPGAEVRVEVDSKRAVCCEAAIYRGDEKPGRVVVSTRLLRCPLEQDFRTK